MLTALDSSPLPPIPLTTHLSCFLIAATGATAIFYGYQQFWKSQGPKYDGEGRRSGRSASSSSSSSSSSSTSSSSSSLVHFTLSELMRIGLVLPFMTMYVALIITLHYHPGNMHAECVDNPPENFPTNWIPSISSCIGNHFPEVVLWRMSVMIGQWGRMCGAIATYGHFNAILRGNTKAETLQMQTTNRFRLWLSVVENVGIVVGSAVSSSECFVVFLFYFIFLFMPPYFAMVFLLFTVGVQRV